MRFPSIQLFIYFFNEFLIKMGLVLGKLNSSTNKLFIFLS